MIERIGRVRNPLTIIAIFAGIAEVSGTTVLPFVNPENQIIFIIYLICFPILLVVIFFLTLNFNNKVLYAPSDYKDEENYIRVFRYDTNMEEKVKLDMSLQEKISTIYEKLLDQQYTIKAQVRKMEASTSINFSSDVLKGINNYSYQISNLPRATEFVEKMKEKGYSFDIYKGPFGESLDKQIKRLEEHQTIWLGGNVSIEIAKEVIIEAKEYFPTLKYIHITNDANEEAPSYLYNEIFIGGSTKTARDRYGLMSLSDNDFKKISEITSIKELHAFIRSYY